tara:strand:+ start:172 stop:558 length:387 start_codon:yes stop_codon:yes gene_type:complete
MKFEFETTFGSGVDPWYAKAERWAKKKPFPWNHLLLGAIAWLTKVWIDAKIYNTMKSVDRQAKSIVQDWEEQDDRTNTRHNIVEEGVFGDEGWSIQITNPVVERGTKTTSTGMVTGSDAPGLQKNEGN